MHLELKPYKLGVEVTGTYTSKGVFGKSKTVNHSKIIGKCIYMATSYKDAVEQYRNTHNIPKFKEHVLKKYGEWLGWENVELHLISINECLTVSEILDEISIKEFKQYLNQKPKEVITNGSRFYYKNRRANSYRKR